MQDNLYSEAQQLGHSGAEVGVAYNGNRVEYSNAVRDVLGLDLDMATLLPGDDAAYGFDNIGEMLTVSPDLIDGYLSAANKISRLAVGDTALPLGSATYSVSKYLLQNDLLPVSPTAPKAWKTGPGLKSTAAARAWSSERKISLGCSTA